MSCYDESFNRISDSIYVKKSNYDKKYYYREYGYASIF